MEITLNNKSKQFNASALNLQQLVDGELQDKQNGIAVAVNEIVISKKEWQNYQLNQNDNVLIIKASQGG